MSQALLWHFLLPGQGWPEDQDVEITAIVTKWGELSDLDGKKAGTKRRGSAWKARFSSAPSG